jgi:hypothetical protein
MAGDVLVVVMDTDVFVQTDTPAANVKVSIKSCDFTMGESLSVTCDKSMIFSRNLAPVFSTNKTNGHDIAEILLKVVLNTIITTVIGNYQEKKYNFH